MDLIQPGLYSELQGQPVLVLPAGSSEVVGFPDALDTPQQRFHLWMAFEAGGSWWQVERRLRKAFPNLHTDSILTAWCDRSPDLWLFSSTCLIGAIADAALCSPEWLAKGEPSAEDLAMVYDSHLYYTLTQTRSSILLPHTPYRHDCTLTETWLEAAGASLNTVDRCTECGDAMLRKVSLQFDCGHTVTMCTKCVVFNAKYHTRRCDPCRGS
jgi:hypothetical protein